MRRLALLATAVLVALVPPAPVGARGAEACTGTATVRWSLDLAVGEVAAAWVRVPGCADGDHVALRLFTDGGPVPAQDLLRGELHGGEVAFDLSGEDLAVAEVTGVFVGLTTPRDTPGGTGAGGDDRVRPGGTGPLAATGASARDVVLVAAGLLLIGWCLVTSRRRRAGRRRSEGDSRGFNPGGSPPRPPARPGPRTGRRP